VLYVGINDNCEVIGVDASDGEQRDALVERAQGILLTVRPSLRADILFAVEERTPVLAIRVLPQDEPVFYYDHRPYIRDGRRSRPATPDEVKERVWAHPGSEHKRRLEELEFRRAETLQQITQRHADQSAERSRMTDAALFRQTNR
jgi:predicted HTH transcriptional regulator